MDGLRDEQAGPFMWLDFSLACCDGMNKLLAKKKKGRMAARPELMP